MMKRQIHENEVDARRWQWNQFRPAVEISDGGMGGRLLGEGPHLLCRLDAINRPAEGLGECRRESARARAEVEHSERAGARRVCAECVDPRRQPVGRQRAATLILRVLPLIVADFLQHATIPGRTLALCARPVWN
jgi:hypothetical protein